MNTLRSEHGAGKPSSGRVLLIGLGGLGCPVALALVSAGVSQLTLCDDDVVDEGNLHRQILYRPEDVGAHKLDVALRRLAPSAHLTGTRIELVKSRFLPDNARELVEASDLVIEGADNYATKFLTADACHLGRRPLVHGAAIRWLGTAWAVSAQGQPCYRCLFEDVPSGTHASCDSAGVMGPVVGVVGAMMAELALRTLAGQAPYASLWTFDGKADTLRQAPIVARSSCALCGRASSIGDIDEARYLSSSRAAAPGPAGESPHQQGAVHGRYRSNPNSVA